MWCADITYIPVQGGFLYLVAIMDWASRRVLAWRLSNTMDTEFCLAALAEALESVHWIAGDRGYTLFDGRSRSVYGQRVHRTAAP